MIDHTHNALMISMAILFTAVDARVVNHLSIVLVYTRQATDGGSESARRHNVSGVHWSQNKPLQ